MALLASSGCNLHADDPIQISYDLAKNQNVSIHIYNSSGTIVRELLHGAAREAGKRTEPWDGRDDAGQPVPSGDYIWKMLSVPGFGAEFITSVGSNYAIDKKDPRFWAQAPGCHGGPDSIAVDTDGFYVGAFTENIETALLKQSLDGSRRLWSNKCPGGWEGFDALAVVGDTLWGYSAPKGKIYRYNKSTGEMSAKIIEGALDKEMPSDMAVDESHIVLAYTKAGVVRWLDFDGKETRKIAIPNASAVDVAPDGTVFVIAGSDMLRLVPTAVAPEPFITNLSNPRRAAINPTNGDIYIALSTPSNQVQRYSKDGKLLKTYGKLGGRVDGEYQSQRESFREILDIAVSSKGDFWVVEPNAAPRRTAQFNADGTLVNEWYGGQVWAPWIAPEPDNPRFVWMASDWNSIMRMEVDYKAKTWKVNACFSYSSLANGLVPGHWNSEDWEARVHKGTLYLCKAQGYPIVLKVDRQQLKIIPSVVVVGNLQHDWSTCPDWLQTKAGGPRGCSVWTDANGDGTPLNADGSLQDSELKIFPDTAPYEANSYVDENLNYLTAGGTTKFTVTSWNSAGSPVYGNLPKGETVVAKPPRLTGAYDDRWSTYAVSDSAGNTWGAFNPNITGWGNSDDSFLARWNPDGTLAWQVGHKGNLPGQFRTLRHIFGVMKSDSGDACMVVGPFSYEWPEEGVIPIYVCDQDGLYAGQLIGKPTNQGDTPNIKYGLGGEALSGTILRDHHGDVYFYSQWINEGRIYKINGWNDWQKADGRVFVPSNYAAPNTIAESIGPDAHGTGLRGSYYTSKDCSGTPALVRVDSKLEMSLTDFGDYNSGRWEGTITPRRTGWHMFMETKGYHAPHMFWVDGKDVSAVELNFDGAPIEFRTGSNHVIWLEAGKPYPFRVEYHRPAVGAPDDGMLLQWSEPETNGSFTQIPVSQFSPP